jgi:hypothetical protein
MCRVDLTDEVWMGTTAGQLYVFRVRDVWEGKGTHSHRCPMTQCSRLTASSAASCRRVGAQDAQPELGLPHGGVAATRRRRRECGQQPNGEEVAGRKWRRRGEQR